MYPTLFTDSKYEPGEAIRHRECLELLLVEMRTHGELRSMRRLHGVDVRQPVSQDVGQQDEGGKVSAIGYVPQIPDGELVCRDEVVVPGEVVGVGGDGFHTNERQSEFLSLVIFVFVLAPEHVVESL